MLGGLCFANLGYDLLSAVGKCLMQPYADSISESNTDDDQVGELEDSHNRRSSRRNRKWKDAQRVASRLSAIFKKPGKHSRDNSLSFSESSRRSEMFVPSPTSLVSVAFLI